MSGGDEKEARNRSFPYLLEEDSDDEEARRCRCIRVGSMSGMPAR